MLRTLLHRSAPLLLAVGLVAGPVAPCARAALPPLYPRESFFGNPERTAPSLSPDGRLFSWVAPTPDGILNVWVQTIGVDQGKPVTKGTGAGIFSYLWAADSRHILYFADRNGDENDHLHLVSLADGSVRDLTPYDGAKALGVETDPDHPDEVLFSLNRRDPRVFDRYRVRLSTGAVSLEAENPGDVVEWLADRNFRVRACAALDPATADVVIRVRDTPDAPWREVTRWPFLETNDINYQKLVAWGEDDRTLIVQNSLTSNYSELKTLDITTGRETGVVAARPDADISNPWGQANLGGSAEVLTDPATGRIQAVAFEGKPTSWTVLDPAMRPDFDLLDARFDGPFFFVAHAADRWIVGVVDDTGPTTYHLYQRSTKVIELLFEDQPALRTLTLAPMTPISFTARDGLVIDGFLTLPVGIEPKSLPLIVNPHGGPWSHDSWGYNPEVQWMANRGYAVLQLNFRGSTGHGKKLLNAGNGEWGRNMQNDVTDGVAWAVAQGIADSKRIGIMGGSYGGYCALAGATFTPDLYRCAVAVVGPANVRTLFASFPPYWGPRKTRWIRRVGDVEKDDALNTRISPLFHADAIRVPVLLAYGANDPRVKLTEAEAMFAAMKSRDLPVSLIVYPDEGHGFGRPENSVDFYGRAEEFLARHLGGRTEPWRPVKGATAELR